MKNNKAKKTKASRSKIKAIEQNNGNSVMIIVAILATIMLAYYLPKSYGIFFPQDEFGYWNNAARIVGIDWSDVALGQSSYAYGYSVLLIPLLVLLKSNPILLYKMAIVLNAFLLIVYVFYFEKLISRVFNGLSKLQITQLTLICAFAPYVVGYVHYTIAEMLIHVLFVMILNAVYDMEEHDMEKKYIIRGGLLCGVLLFVHYRTIGVTFTFVIIVLSHYIRTTTSSRNRVIVSIVCICILFLTVCVISLTGYFSLSELIKVENIKELTIGVIGKIFYVIVATLGLGGIGIATMINNIKSTLNRFYILAFGFLCFISAYFFLGSMRIDHLVYGRYIEMFLPFLLCVGINTIIEKKVSWKTLTGVVTTTIILSIFMFFHAAKVGLTDYISNFVCGIDWMLGNRASTVLMLYIKPMYLTVISILLIALFSKRKLFAEILLVTMIAVSLGSSKWVIDNNVYFFHNCDETDYELSLQIEELMKKKPNLIFLDSPYNNYINLMQYWLIDKPITLVQGLDPEAFNTPNDAIIITHANYEASEQLTERYSEYMQSSHFFVYFNY